MVIKNAYEKNVFPFGGCDCHFSAFAQQPNIGFDLESKFKSQNLNNAIDSLSRLLNKNLRPSFATGKLSHALPNGDKVFLLPVDHMPCIVSNMSQYNYAMPAYKGKLLGRIPNASPPQEIIPRDRSK